MTAEDMPVRISTPNHDSKMTLAQAVSKIVDFWCERTPDELAPLVRGAAVKLLSGEVISYVSTTNMRARLELAKYTPAGAIRAGYFTDADMLRDAYMNWCDMRGLDSMIPPHQRMEPEMAGADSDFLHALVAALAQCDAGA